MKKIYQKFCRFEEQLALVLLAGLTLRWCCWQD